MLETLDYTIRIGSTPTFLYFNLYLYSAYAAHYVYLTIYGRLVGPYTDALPIYLIWSRFCGYTAVSGTI